MSGENSVIPFTSATRRDIQESIGITRFGQNEWNQIIGGLVFQGGIISTPGVIAFSSPLQLQLLGLFVSAGTISSESLTGFTASSAGYWFAIGV